MFNRIWDTPDNGYAEKFKHSIEPVLTISTTSSVDNFDRDRQARRHRLRSSAATSLTYGINNRFYAKRKPQRRAGRPRRARSSSVELTQSYYTNQLAAQYDRQYQSNNVPGSVDAPQSHFSPIALSVRAMPTDEINATSAPSSTPATTR